MVSPPLFNAINADREEDTGNFRIVRGTMDTTIEFHHVEAFLVGYYIPDGGHPPDVNFKDQLQSWGMGEEAVTAGVRFLSQQSYAWDESGAVHYRSDLITFGAGWDDDE